MVASLVMRSPSMAVSSASVAVGVAGISVSMLNENSLLAPEALPAASIAMAVKVVSPSARASMSSGVNDQLPSPSARAVPIWTPLAETVTVALASALPVSVGVASLVLSPSPSAPAGSTSSVALSMVGASGMPVSTVSVNELLAPDVLSLSSVAIAVKTASPSGSASTRA
ncbi:hypothetical protein BTW07_18525 [Salinicola socius]|uniref:Uncharacterized protein n=1 Tax=Salinicola socius TaxID=404433 RepID=A0A1Q8SMK6_9GAMM|nr:hypothetical protein BTW07_18525 [Salinicola socius]